ncbi:hypothetical protein F4801DRAFT_562605 [Xylaria longipes]|nr:hypothetical protein F4801DRAFT_562605 [Xylaria longipes]RYC59704.1 hypothetical protein CHU98_g6497 [Xylaria longipes]
MSSEQQSSSSSSYFIRLPWGCKIMTDRETDWPVSAAITHGHPNCECNGRFGSELEIVRDYLVVVAYEFCYRKDPEKYNSKWSGEILSLQARRLVIDLKTMEAGLKKSIPWRRCFRRYEVVEVNGKLVSTPIPSDSLVDHHS